MRFEKIDLVRGPGNFRFLLDSERDFVNPLARALGCTEPALTKSDLVDATTRATWLAGFGRLQDGCDVISEAASSEGATERFWNALAHFLDNATWKHTSGAALNSGYEDMLSRLGAQLGEQFENRKKKLLKRTFKDAGMRL